MHTFLFTTSCPPGDAVCSCILTKQKSLAHADVPHLLAQLATPEPFEPFDQFPVLLRQLRVRHFDVVCLCLFWSRRFCFGSEQAELAFQEGCEWVCRVI